MESRWLGAAVVLSAMLMALPAAAQRVIDGDTIVLDGIHWRLWGIDAPETHQACADGWQAGLEATAAMRKLIEGRAVACELRGHDRYKRSIGLCRAGGEDLSADMVSAGHGLGIHAVQLGLHQRGEGGDRGAGRRVRA